jgi:hypothetical protein
MSGRFDDTGGKLLPVTASARAAAGAGAGLTASAKRGLALEVSCSAFVPEIVGFRGWT